MKFDKLYTELMENENPNIIRGVKNASNFFMRKSGAMLDKKLKSKRPLRKQKHKNKERDSWYQ